MDVNPCFSLNELLQRIQLASIPPTQSVTNECSLAQVQLEHDVFCNVEVCKQLAWGVISAGSECFLVHGFRMLRTAIDGSMCTGDSAWLSATARAFIQCLKSWGVFPRMYPIVGDVVSELVTSGAFAVPIEADLGALLGVIHDIQCQYPRYTLILLSAILAARAPDDMSAIQSLNEAIRQAWQLGFPIACNAVDQGDSSLDSAAVDFLCTALVSMGFQYDGWNQDSQYALLTLIRAMSVWPSSSREICCQIEKFIRLIPPALLVDLIQLICSITWNYQGPQWIVVNLLVMAISGLGEEGELLARILPPLNLFFTQLPLEPRLATSVIQFYSECVRLLRSADQAVVQTSYTVLQSVLKPITTRFVQLRSLLEKSNSSVDPIACNQPILIGIEQIPVQRLYTTAVASFRTVCAVMSPDEVFSVINQLATEACQSVDHASPLLHTALEMLSPLRQRDDTGEMILRLGENCLQALSQSGSTLCGCWATGGKDVARAWLRLAAACTNACSVPLIFVRLMRFVSWLHNQPQVVYFPLLQLSVSEISSTIRASARNGSSLSPQTALLADDLLRAAQETQLAQLISASALFSIAIPDGTSERALSILVSGVIAASDTNDSPSLQSYLTDLSHCEANIVSIAFQQPRFQQAISRAIELGSQQVASTSESAVQLLTAAIRLAAVDGTFTHRSSPLCIDQLICQLPPPVLNRLLEQLGDAIDVPGLITPRGIVHGLRTCQFIGGTEAISDQQLLNNEVSYDRAVQEVWRLLVSVLVRHDLMQLIQASNRPGAERESLGPEELEFLRLTVQNQCACIGTNSRARLRRWLDQAGTGQRRIQISVPVTPEALTPRSPAHRGRRRPPVSNLHFTDRVSERLNRLNLSDSDDDFGLA